MEHLKCPHYQNCKNYNPNYKICNKTSGLVGNKVARCVQLYQKLNKSVTTESMNKHL